jgi:hypothetical protein
MTAVLRALAGFEDNTSGAAGAASDGAAARGAGDTFEAFRGLLAGVDLIDFCVVGAFGGSTFPAFSVSAGSVLCLPCELCVLGALSALCVICVPWVFCVFGVFCGSLCRTDDDEPVNDDGSPAGVPDEAGVLLDVGDLKRAIPATLPCRGQTSHFRTRTPAFELPHSALRTLGL